jgi:hypothetical protein
MQRNGSRQSRRIVFFTISDLLIPGCLIIFENLIPLKAGCTKERLTAWLTRRLWRGATLVRLTYGIPHYNHEVNSNPALVQPALNNHEAYMLANSE